MTVFIIILLTALAGGSVPVLAKVALEVLKPFTLVMVRFFLASLVLLPFIYNRRELNYKTFRGLFKVALVGSLNPILLFIALQFTKASVSPLIYAVVPSMTAIYLWKYENKSISIKQVFGIFAGLMGVSIIVLLPMIEAGNTDFQALQGNLLILGAAVAFLIYGLVSKKKQQKYSVSPIALTFYFALVTFIISIPFSAYELVQDSSMLTQIQPKHILAALSVGVFGTSVFYLAYQYALKLSSELTAALFTYLQPVATIFIALILLGEKITVPFIIGGVLAVIGAQIALSR